jgi:alpha-N-arabinofuranosidase
MNPAILRLPGGNFLEGGSIATRFDWEKTVGPLERRPGHAGCWGYRASDGLGLLEFLEWCEDMHAQPVLAVYAGYSLDHEHVSLGAGLQPFVDAALAMKTSSTNPTATTVGLPSFTMPSGRNILP